MPVEVYEQAEAFGRIGAAIQLTPNAVRLLDRLGLGAPLRDVGSRPPGRIARAYDTGEVVARADLGDAAERRFGAPVLTMHRADLLAVLEAAVPSETVRFGRCLVALTQDDDHVNLRFGDGSTVDAEAVVGADGIHSTVRAATQGDEPPHYTGMVAYRSIIPMDRLRGELDDDHLRCFTKWWGPTKLSQLVTFPISGGRELSAFATVPAPGDRPESWSIEGSVTELRAAFAEYHPDAQAVLDAVDTTLRTALYDRDPLGRWTTGRATLLGDACHAMAPFMAQGAATAMEDGVVLARRLVGADPSTVQRSFESYEESRRPRTDRIQLGSRENWWLRDRPDPTWVYGFDAWEERNVVADLSPSGEPVTSS